MRSVACLVFCAITLTLTSSSQQNTLAISNVTVVDVESGKLLPNRTLVIQGNTIKEVATVANTMLPKTAVVVDGTGKFVIPGLWDMHAHTWSSEFFFPLLIANGVTGVREMFSTMKDVDTWREGIKNGTLDGPIIFSAGPIVGGPNPVWNTSVSVKDPADVPRIIDSLKNTLHVDFIKVYSRLPEETYLAIAAECKKQHIDFEGHVPDEVTVQEAVQAGQRSLEHLRAMLWSASDSSEEYYRRVRTGTLVNNTFTDFKNILEWLIDTFSERKLDEMIAEIKAHDTWVCPTLVASRGRSYDDTPALTTDKRMQYLQPFFTGFWLPKRTPEQEAQLDTVRPVRKKDFEMKMRIVKRMQDAGVNLLIGTDYPNPFCYPGFSVHDEMSLFVQAGVTPLQALQAATIKPAEFFHLTDKLGNIKPGMIANLILLDKNPLSDIDNTRLISSVILNGELFNRAALDKLLATVRSKVAKK